MHVAPKVVTRPKGIALGSLRLPRFAAAGHEIADVRGVDGVKRVLIFWIGERDAERAAAGEREVIGVARVLFRVESSSGSRLAAAGAGCFPAGPIAAVARIRPLVSVN